MTAGATGRRTAVTIVQEVAVARAVPVAPEPGAAGGGPGADRGGVVAAAAGGVRVEPDADAEHAACAGLERRDGPHHADRSAGARRSASPPGTSRPGGRRSTATLVSVAAPVFRTVIVYPTAAPARAFFGPFLLSDSRGVRDLGRRARAWPGSSGWVGVSRGNTGVSGVVPVGVSDGVLVGGVGLTSSPDGMSGQSSNDDGRAGRVGARGRQDEGLLRRRLAGGGAGDPGEGAALGAGGDGDGAGEGRARP